MSTTTFTRVAVALLLVSKPVFAQTVHSLLRPRQNKNSGHIVLSSKRRSQWYLLSTKFPQDLDLHPTFHLCTGRCRSKIRNMRKYACQEDCFSVILIFVLEGLKHVSLEKEDPIFVMLDSAISAKIFWVIM